MFCDQCERHWVNCRRRTAKRQRCKLLRLAEETVEVLSYETDNCGMQFATLAYSD
jgi:hypothetical protein